MINQITFAVLAAGALAACTQERSITGPLGLSTDVRFDKSSCPSGGTPPSGSGAAALFVGCGGGVEQPRGSVRAATLANGASTTTQQFHDEIIRFTEPDFCLPQPTTVTWAVTWTLHEVIHFTTHPDGTFSAIDEVSGTTLTVPSDPSQPTYTGPLTFTFESVASSHASVTQFTAEVRARGTDGSTLRFQLIGHLSVSATGATTSFTEGPGRVCTPA